MAEKIESKIKRLENSEKQYEKKAKREWAYAKNAENEVEASRHYKNARYAYERVELYKNKADEYRKLEKEN